jgi:hypothetical protein
MSEYEIGQDMLSLKLRVERLEAIINQMLEDKQKANATTRPTSAI